MSARRVMRSLARDGGRSAFMGGYPLPVPFSCNTATSPGFAVSTYGLSKAPQHVLQRGARIAPAILECQSRATGGGTAAGDLRSQPSVAVTAPQPSGAARKLKGKALAGRCGRTRCSLLREASLYLVPETTGQPVKEEEES